MKNIMKCYFFLTISFFVASCSDDNEDIITPSQSNEVSSNLKSNLTKYAKTEIATNQFQEYYEDLGCFTINYPYSITDGQIEIDIENEQDIIDFFANPQPIFFDYVYPLNITLEDGTQESVFSELEMSEILISCSETDGGDFDVEECFALNFPVQAITFNVETFEEEIVTVNNESELYLIPVFDFVYPITITLSDGAQDTINSTNDFDMLFNECYGIDNCEDCEENCFEIVYPNNIVLENGTVVTINNDQEMFEFLENHDQHEFFTFTYPINVESPDGNQQTVNNDEEFNELFISCYTD